MSFPHEGPFLRYELEHTVKYGDRVVTVRIEVVAGDYSGMRLATSSVEQILKALGPTAVEVVEEVAP